MSRPPARCGPDFADPRPAIPNGWQRLGFAAEEIAPGDGPIAQFRRWYRQFYA